MSQKIWTSQIDKIGIANGGVNSDPFYVPEGSVSLTVFMPTMSNTAKLQALTPKDADTDTDVWTDLSILTQPAVTGPLVVVTTAVFTSAGVFSLDAQILGGGVFRFVSAGAEGAARTIRLAWSCIR